MAANTVEKEAKIIEELAVDAIRLIEEDDNRKDLKEKRGVIKQTFYGGPHKMRHMISIGNEVVGLCETA
jgi:hypothetical protein